MSKKSSIGFRASYMLFMLLIMLLISGQLTVTVAKRLRVSHDEPSVPRPENKMKT